MCQYNQSIGDHEVTSLSVVVSVVHVHVAMRALLKQVEVEHLFADTCISISTSYPSVQNMTQALGVSSQ